jgi:hypothetical protein
MPNNRASDSADLLGSWERHEKLITYRLDELKEHTAKCEAEWGKANVKLSEIDRDLTALKARAGAWGAMAGGLFGIVSAVVVAWLT